MINAQFNLSVVNFAYARNDEINQDGHHFEFSLISDLGLAIHGTANLRYHRIYYDKINFEYLIVMT